ncbi:hypothetical protein FD755_009248 [Muntiacus reevesi]|uniref:Uncharacterized protein n=1 Tax=Muntiacus reevesi TaxID=9886 RepID=A0A5N3XUR8_MUNRE|nr:hypothetical protein FD755_009248 [Muntiacus reevesi]
MEMMLDQKQIQVIFLSEFQMDHKAAETTHSSNNASGPETANKRSVQWYLEDEEHSGRPSEVDNDQLRAISEADSLTTVGEIAKELNIDHSTVIWHLKQTGKVSSSLILHNNNKPFLDWIVMCDKKWILCDSWL